MGVNTSAYHLILLVSSVDAIEHVAEFVTKEALTAIHKDTNVASRSSFILSSTTEFRQPNSHSMKSVLRN
jgi:hypothetical protein